MFEARLTQANILKMVVDAMKDLVQEANFDCSDSGISLQAMDSSHVCLVGMLLRANGFDHYRCDRPLSMGVHLGNLSKILKCAGGDDIVTLKAEDSGDLLTLMFESANQERISDFDLKLMSIDSEHLGIPDQEYAATVKMPAKEYQRICRDLATIGDTVVISATKNGIKFSTGGDIGTGNITCRHSVTADKVEEQTVITLNEPVSLTFALRYMNNFSKATPLGPVVTMSLAKDLPVVVEYAIGELGHVKFFLAPKIEDDEEMGGGGGGEDATEAQS